MRRQTVWVLWLFSVLGFAGGVAAAYEVMSPCLADSFYPANYCFNGYLPWILAGVFLGIFAIATLMAYFASRGR